MNIDIPEVGWKWLAAGASSIGYLLFLSHRMGKVEKELSTNTEVVKALSLRIDKLMETR